MVYIINVLIIFIISISSQISLAAESLPFRPDDKSFLKKWHITPRFTQTKDKQQAAFQTFNRNLTIAHHSYTIGTLNYMELPEEAEVNKREMLESLKLGFDIEQWKVRHQGRITIWEADWKKASRRVRVAIKEENKLTKIVTTVYRIGYQEPMAIESYIIENALFGQQKKTSFTPLPQLLLDLAFPQAHAQVSFPNLGPIIDSIGGPDLLPSVPPGTGGSGPIPGIPSIPGMPGGGSDPINVTGDFDFNINMDPDVITNWDNTNTQIGIGNQNWDNTNTQIGIGNQNWDNTNTQIGIANQNWDNTNTQIGIANQNWEETNAQIGVANQNWADTNAQLEIANQNWAETNVQAARANDIAAKLADPGHMFLLSGATAAGAVAGGMAANLAIQGLTMGIDWMIERMTGARAANERWRQFQEARSNWEDTMAHAMQLEQAIDQFLLFHETINTIRDRLPPHEREKLSSEGLIRFFNIEILMKQREKSQIEALFNQTSDASCSLALAEKITDLNTLIASMSHVVSTLDQHKKENPDANIFDDRYFCSQMDHMMRNLLDAESAIQRYRMHLINGQAEWRRDLAQSMGDLHNVSGRLQNNGDDILNREIGAANQLYETNYNALRDRLRNECRQSGMMLTGGCVSQKLSGPAASEYQNIVRQRDNAIEQARISAQRRLDRPVTINADIEYDRLRSYQDWFEELEDQQFCNQRPDEPRCMQLSQFRHNGVFYVKNRAISKMDDVCQNNRTTIAAIEEAEARAVSGLSDSARGPAAAPDLSTPAEPQRKGFFEAFFGGIADFFRSIGEFLGLVPKRTAVIGEAPYQPRSLETAATAPEETHIIDSPRVIQPVSATLPTPRELGERRSPATEIAIEQAFTNSFFESDAISDLVDSDVNIIINESPQLENKVQEVLRALDPQQNPQSEVIEDRLDHVLNIGEGREELRPLLFTKILDHDIAQLDQLVTQHEQNQVYTLNLSFLTPQEKEALSSSLIEIRDGELIINSDRIPPSKKTYSYYVILDLIYQESRKANIDREALRGHLQRLHAHLH